MTIRCLLVLCVLTAPAAVRAAEVLRADVERSGERFSVEFVVLIEGRAGPVLDLLTDYQRLAEWSPTVIASRTLRDDENGVRIALTMRPCVLVVLCKTVTRVSDVEVERAAWRLRYDMVPALSDFRYGHETVTLLPQPGHRVRLHYQAVFEPAFSVPRGIGTWLVRRAMVNEIETTSRRVEELLRRRRP